MGPTQLNGLPAHPLLIHVVVASVQLAALLVTVAALWPAARRRLGILPPLVALVALAVVPVTMNAGEWLKKTLESSTGPNPAIEHHEEIAERLLPWVIALFVVAVLTWALLRRPNVARPLQIGLGVAALVVSAGGTRRVYQRGDIGAHAVWDGVVPTGNP